MFINIKLDKNGRKRAYKWSRRGICWMPMKLKDAEVAIATGKAIECKDTPTPEAK